jgi:hypothetical protein
MAAPHSLTSRGREHAKSLVDDLSRVLELPCTTVETNTQLSGRRGTRPTSQIIMASSQAPSPQRQVHQRSSWSLGRTEHVVRQRPVAHHALHLLQHLPSVKHHTSQTTPSDPAQKTRNIPSRGAWDDGKGVLRSRPPPDGWTGRAYPPLNLPVLRHEEEDGRDGRGRGVVAREPIR